MPRKDDAVTIPLRGPTLGATEGAAAVRESAYSVEINSEQSYEQGGELLHEITREMKRLKAEMDATIRPINDGIKRIRGMYKPALDSLTAAQGALKEHMLSYRARMEAHREHADRAARRALAAGNHQKAMAHVAAATAETPRVAGVSVRKTWKVRIINPDAIPRQFMTVDAVALRKDAMARGWAEPPPGVEYVQEEGIAAI